jgi:membrane fusion protein
MANLFRPEALESGERQWLGGVQLTRPISFAVLTLLIVAASIGAAAFLVVGEYTRKARVTGYLVPDRGVIRLVAPRSGSLVESHASEGLHVHRGDVLFILDIGQTTASGSTQAMIERSLAAREVSLTGSIRREAELRDERIAAIDIQVEGMRRELASMASEAILQDQRIELAQEAMKRIESLRGDNFVSSAQVQNKAEEVLGLKAQRQSLDRQLTVRRREMAVLTAQRREIPLHTKAAQDEIERNLSALVQQTAENEAHGRVVVRAPQDGILTGVLAEPGQSISSETSLASLVPSDARLQAHLYAPSSAVGFVRADQSVVLRYQAFPFQKFGHQTGRVTQVSRSPLQSTELAGLPFLRGGSQEPLYRITVTLDHQSVSAYGELQPLAPGMQLEGDIQLDHRRLIEWIFEPVLGIAGRV